MTAAERAYAEAREQGLPAKVSDPHTLDRLAVLMAERPAEGVADAA